MIIKSCQARQVGNLGPFLESRDLLETPPLVKFHIEEKQSIDRLINGRPGEAFIHEGGEVILDI